jgi:hypothetical protein
MGTASDSTEFVGSVSTTDPRHYIHIVAHDDYRFKGIPNITQLYKRAGLRIGNPSHVIVEGIQIDQGARALSPYVLYIYCYQRSNLADLLGSYVNSILRVETTQNVARFYNSLINCTVFSTIIVPELSVSINCIVTGSSMNSYNFVYRALGTVTPYSSGPISLFCKYGETIVFNNPSVYDYRLSWSDTAAKCQGIYTGSYLENLEDIELQLRGIRSSYGADEAELGCAETLHGSDMASRVKFLMDILRGLDSPGITTVLETLYCLPEDLYRGALSGRILIRVQKKIARIYRI